MTRYFTWTLLVFSLVFITGNLPSEAGQERHHSLRILSTNFKSNIDRAPQAKGRRFQSISNVMKNRTSTARNSARNISRHHARQGAFRYNPQTLSRSRAPH